MEQLKNMNKILSIEEIIEKEIIDNLQIKQ